MKDGMFVFDAAVHCQDFSDGQIKDVWEKGVGLYAADGQVLGVEGAIFEMRG